MPDFEYIDNDPTMSREHYNDNKRRAEKIGGEFARLFKALIDMVDDAGRIIQRLEKRERALGKQSNDQEVSDG